MTHMQETSLQDSETAPSDAESISAMAEDYLQQHGLLRIGWRFRFDHARRRAGSCNYRDRVITVSKHLIGHSLEQVEQVILHEIAHALAGQGAGHGPRWKHMAREIGYRGKRTLNIDLAKDEAKWLGTCPAGHEFYRFRKPSGKASCVRCSPRFNDKYVITWKERNVHAR